MSEAGWMGKLMDDIEAESCPECGVPSTCKHQGKRNRAARTNSGIDCGHGADGEDTWEAAFHRSEKRRLDAWEEVATLRAELDAVVGAGRSIGEWRKLRGE